MNDGHRRQPLWRKRRATVAASTADEIKFAEQFLDAANHATGSARNVYLGVLGFAFFLALVTRGLTDAKLLLDSSVALPLVQNVDLPFSAFYAVAPCLLVLLHGDLLLNLSLLAAKLHHLIATVRIIEKSDSAAAERVRARVAGFPFAHWIAGTSEHRFVESAIVWLTVILLTPAVLLYAQIRFLPYHSETITWLHRACVVIDLLLIASFWPSYVCGMQGRNFATWWWRNVRHPLRRRWLPTSRGWLSKQSSADRGAMRIGALTLAALAVAFVIATLPDEPLSRITWGRLNTAKFVHRNLEITETALDARGPLSPEVTAKLRTGIEHDLQVALDQVEPIDLRGRDLRHANLSRIVLPKADLRGAKLSGTLLIAAMLPHATANEATTFADAVLSQAQLQGATLAGTNLQRAILGGATLYGVDLSNADLRAASLYGAKLQGANLSMAQMQRARLDAAGLQAARLDFANLSEASLERAKLQGATLDGAELTGATLESAELQGAALSLRTTLHAATLTRAFWELSVSLGDGIGVLDWWDDTSDSSSEPELARLTRGIDETQAPCPSGWSDKIIETSYSSERRCIESTGAQVEHARAVLLGGLLCGEVSGNEEAGARLAIARRFITDMRTDLGQRSFADKDLWRSLLPVNEQHERGRATFGDDPSPSGREAAARRREALDREAAVRRQAALTARLKAAALRLTDASCELRTNLSADELGTVNDWLRLVKLR